MAVKKVTYSDESGATKTVTMDVPDGMSQDELASQLAEELPKFKSPTSTTSPRPPAGIPAYPKAPTPVDVDKYQHFQDPGGRDRMVSQLQDMLKTGTAQGVGSTLGLATGGIPGMMAGAATTTPENLGGITGGGVATMLSHLIPGSGVARLAAQGGLAGLGYLTGDAAQKQELPSPAAAAGTLALSAGSPALVGGGVNLYKALNPNYWDTAKRAAKLTAASGTNARTNIPEAFNAVLPELEKTVNSGAASRPTTVSGLRDLVQATMGRREDEFQKALSPIKDRMVDASPVAASIRAEITPNMANTSEGLKDIAAIEVRAKEFDKPWKLGDLNAERSRLFRIAKTARAERAAQRTNADVMADDSASKGLRALVYDHLQESYPGYDFRKLKQDEAMLYDLGDQLDTRNTSLANRQGLHEGMTLFERLSPTAGIHGGGLSTRLHNILDLFSNPQGSADSKVAKAFVNIGKGLPEEVPDVRQPLALLEAGAHRMPGIEDPSGTMGGPGPYMGRGMSPDNGARRLAPPSGPIRPAGPIPDASGPTGGAPYMGAGISPDVGSRMLPPPSRQQVGGFAVADDLVPVKHPVTGKIEYVPKWMLQQAEAAKEEPIDLTDFLTRGKKKKR